MYIIINYFKIYKIFIIISGKKKQVSLADDRRLSNSCIARVKLLKSKVHASARVKVNTSVIYQDAIGSTLPKVGEEIEEYSCNLLCGALII